MRIRSTLLPAATAALLIGGAAPPAQAQRDGGGGASEEGRRAAMERAGSDAFERGYRQGRDEERRRQEAASSGRDSRAGSSSGRGPDAGSSGGGGRGETTRYWYVPDVLPDGPAYRGLQDYALVPDYSRQMDRMLVAAQSLREAIQAAAQLPASEGRNRAMDRLREALIETQQAMVLLPQEARLRY